MKIKFLLISSLLVCHSLYVSSLYAETEESININQEKLQKCSDDLKTGYYSDGYCNTGSDDSGIHIVCARVTTEFLDFTKGKGNDLSTSRGNFVGLKDGDYWCLCALRWLEAYNTNNNAIIPKIKLGATHKKMLDYIDKSILENYKDTL